MENSSLTSAYDRRGGVTRKVVSRTGMDSAFSKIATGEKTVAAGETLKAKVVNFLGRELTLRLPDGTMVQAQTSQGTALSIGQNAEFQVLSSNKEQLLLRLINSDSANSADSIAGRALAAASLPVNETNLRLVNTLLENRLPVDAESIRSLAQQHAAHPDTDIKVLAQMHKIHMPVNQATINQYQSYLNYEHSLMPQFQTLSDILNDPEIAALLEKNGISEQELNVVMPQNVALEEEALTSDAGSMKQMLTDEQLQPENRSAESATMEKGPELTETASPEKGLQSTENASPEKGLQTAETASPEKGLQPTETASPEKGLQPTETASPEKRPELTDSKSRDKSTQPVDFLKRWTISPEKLREKGAIEETFRRINSDLEKLEKTLLRIKESGAEVSEKAGKLLEDALNASTNLKDNIEFMNLLNRFFPYVQLPLKMEDKYKQGELYVYTRKKTKQGEDAASVLLHLDMENLGATDIYLGLAGKTLGAKFYLADNDITRLFEENIPELTERLEKKGLTVNYEFLPREEEDNPVHEFLATDSGVSMKRYRFDCRA